MQLECPHCQNALAVADSLRRYYDMPVRCHQCRHVFTLTRQTPRDDSGLAHDPRQPLDRSVSARRSHHMIVCQGCGAGLRVPGQRLDAVLTITCPHCLASFVHHQTGRVARSDWLIIGLLVGIAAGCAVLWAHFEGYIELRNLGEGELPDYTIWLQWFRQMLADLVGQLKTAAMARLV